MTKWAITPTVDMTSPTQMRKAHQAKAVVSAAQYKAACKPDKRANMGWRAGHRTSAVLSSTEATKVDVDTPVRSSSRCSAASTAFSQCFGRCLRDRAAGLRVLSAEFPPRGGARSAGPPGDFPQGEASSIGTMKTFWLGDSANACSARTVLVRDEVVEGGWIAGSGRLADKPRRGRLCLSGAFASFGEARRAASRRPRAIKHDSGLAALGAGDVGSACLRPRG